MGEVLTPDLCVIGAGAGGLSVAAIAASFGVPVVLIEKGRMGGECLNVGCVPSKALLAAAGRAHAIRGAGPFGLSPGEPEVDYGRLHDHLQRVIGAIAPNDSVERLAALGVRVLRAEARFVDRRIVRAAGIAVAARRFVIASGSRPARPAIPGLDEVPYLTNETVFDLTRAPERLLILGGGPVGVELAQAHRRLGAEVVLVEAGRLLPREDPEMAAVVERALSREGVMLRTGATVARVVAEGGRLTLRLAGAEGGEEAIEGSHLLVAAGRVPTTDGLGLEAAGVAYGLDGIAVDRALRTTNRRVYAVGDCVGGEAGRQRFTHVANAHAGLVIRNALFRLPVRFDPTRIPRVVYTDPEIASVGLTEEGARAGGGAVRILRWPMTENDRAQAERATQGHVKAIVTPKGRILGCAIAAPHAGELIVPWSLALAKGLKVQDLAGLVFPYPTFSEASRRAAVEFVRPGARNPWVRRLVGALRRLG